MGQSSLLPIRSKPETKKPTWLNSAERGFPLQDRRVLTVCGVHWAPAPRRRRSANSNPLCPLHQCFLVQPSVARGGEFDSYHLHFQPHFYLTRNKIMKNPLAQLCCTALFLGTLSLTGCGDSEAPAIVGGPTPEIQAQLDARSAEYGASMAKSMKSNPSRIVCSLSDWLAVF